MQIETHAIGLDLLFIDEGETYSDNLGIMVYSPGDLDSDGYSEAFASNALGEIKVYYGGNPADTIPDHIYLCDYGVFHWLSDINGDTFLDLAILRNRSGIGYFDIYFGMQEFYENAQVGLSISGDLLDGFGVGIYPQDYNGDGKIDIIINAQNAEPYAGKFYLYDGNNELDSVCDDTISICRYGVDIFTIGACVGDINCDGYADYVISPDGNAMPGYTLILWGSEDPDSVPDLQIDSPFDDAIGIGYFSAGVIPLGDINKDNIDDFIVTSEGFPPCIFYGGNPFDPTPKILEYPGKVANVCGDINHDGWEDIAVGFVSYSFGSGEVLVYFGAYDMDTIADIIMPYNSVSPSSYNFGRSVGPAGDFNGDGVDDLAVGAKSYNTQNSSGYLYVFAGDPDLPTPAEDEPDIPIPEDHNILKQNYPNPFNNRTIIKYYLHGISEREIEIDIYNILGQKIRTLYKGVQSGGSHSIYWDGRDNYDNDVPSGIYFYQLQSGDQIISKKMLYLK